MKKDMALEDFKRHVQFIYAHTKTWMLKNVDKMPLKLANGEERQPVAVLDSHGNTLLAFPSVSTASRIIGISVDAITKALARGTCCEKWRRITPQEYRKQHVSVDNVRRVLEALKI
jgi:hypothetical protein